MLYRILVVLLLVVSLPATATVSSTYYSQWLELIYQPAASLSQREKVIEVDRYINRANYISDLQAFGVEDHWASPSEFMLSGQGDCEDFAIAKFLTLLSMGIDEQHLRLVFGRLADGTRHMLVAYYETPESEPLLLDNITRTPTPALMRKDFKPLYSFNRSTYWLMPSWEKQLTVPGSIDSLPWQAVLNRWQPELLASR